MAGFSGAGVAAGVAWPYYAGVALAALLLAWQALRVRIESPTDCLAKFKNNSLVGLAIFAGIVAAQGFTDAHSAVGEKSA